MTVAGRPSRVCSRSRTHSEIIRRRKGGRDVALFGVRLTIGTLVWHTSGSLIKI
jgi:hypothetical protein